MVITLYTLFSVNCLSTDLAGYSTRSFDSNMYEKTTNVE